MKRIKAGLLLAAGLIGATLAFSQRPALAQAQRMAVPAYAYPGAAWTQMEAAAPTVGILIANPNSGPGAKLDPTYASAITMAQAKGLTVLGYVHTSYGKRPIAEVKAEVKDYADWYHVSGIFFDEVASGADMLPYYKQCYTYVHTLAPTGKVVLNPGTSCAEGYMKVSNIICTWETEEPDYLSKYQPIPWTSKYPASRFWHIVLAVPASDLPKIIALTKKRHAGWVYATSLGEKNNANPYGALPDPTYWTTEMKALAAK